MGCGNQFLIYRRIYVVHCSVFNPLAAIYFLTARAVVSRKYCYRYLKLNKFIVEFCTEQTCFENITMKDDSTCG